VNRQIGMEFERAVRSVKDLAMWLTSRSDGQVRGQIVRYGIVAGSGYVLAIGFYTVELAIGIAPYAGLGITFVLNGVYNFLLIRLWAFPASGRGICSDFTRFCAVAAVSFGINYASFALLYSAINFSAATSQRLAIIIAAPITFIANRLWSFRAHRREPMREFG
jgi:putative flippase GtrA